MEQNNNQNENGKANIVVLLCSLFLMVVLIVVGFKFVINLVDNQKKQPLLTIADSSIRTSIDPYDLESIIITGEVKNQSDFPAELAIVTVYYEDYSGIEHIVDVIDVRNLSPKSTRTFKTRITAYEMKYGSGISRIYAEVE